MYGGRPKILASALPELAARQAAGESLTSIAGSLGVSTSAVWNRLNKAGLLTPVRRVVFDSYPDNPAAIKLMHRYRAKAKKHGREFSLSVEEFIALTSGECHYCGVPPAATETSHARTYPYNGLDRVDNGRGYELGNIVPCCKRCNVAKNDMPLEEFLTLVERISAHQKRRALRAS